MYHLNPMRTEKCKIDQQKIVLWSSMNKEIDNVLSKCDTGFKLVGMNAKELFITRAWHIVLTNVFIIDSSNCLLVVE